MLFSTTVPTGTAWTTTISRIRLLINGLEQYFSTANWESLHGDLMSRIGHIQAYDTSVDNDDVHRYSFMEMIPENKDTFVLDSKGASSMVLKITAGDAQPLRVLPIEIVAV